MAREMVMACSPACSSVEPTGESPASPSSTNRMFIAQLLRLLPPAFNSGSDNSPPLPPHHQPRAPAEKEKKPEASLRVTIDRQTSIAPIGCGTALDALEEVE